MRTRSTVVVVGILWVVAGAGVVAARAGCVPPGRYKFIIDSVTPPNAAVQPGMRLDLDGPAMVVDTCAVAKSHFKETAWGARIVTKSAKCRGRDERITLVGEVRMPSCASLSGVLTTGRMPPVHVTAHLRRCDQDPDVTNADIHNAVASLELDKLGDVWGDGEAFIGMVQRVQARLGCAFLRSRPVPSAGAMRPRAAERAASD